MLRCNHGTAVHPIRSAILVICAAMQSACVGVQFIYTKHVESIPIHSSKGYVAGAQLCADNIGTRMCKPNERPPTVADVISLRGRPVKQYSSDGKDFLVYHNGDLYSNWMFIYLVVLPVPLWLPQGQHEMTLVFEKNSLSKQIEDATVDTFYGCRIFTDPRFPETKDHCYW